MKISELLSDLREKESYKNFKKENPDAFFCSAMVVLGEGDKVDLNFFIPSKNRISSFAMPFCSLTNHEEEILGQKEIVNLDFVVDACDLPRFIKRKLDKNFSKYIAVLHDGTWNVTCLDGLRISRVKIGVYDAKFEEKGSGSLMEMVRIKKKASEL